MTRGDSSCRASWRSKAATTSGSRGEYPLLLACRKYKSFDGSIDKIMSYILDSPLAGAALLNVHRIWCQVVKNLLWLHDCSVKRRVSNFSPLHKNKLLSRRGTKNLNKFEKFPKLDFLAHVEVWVFFLNTPDGKVRELYIPYCAGQILFLVVTSGCQDIKGRVNGDHSAHGQREKSPTCFGPTKKGH